MEEEEEEERRYGRAALSMMAKMGFKGRLGKAEDGRVEPVELVANWSGRGLGAAPSSVGGEKRKSEGEKKEKEEEEEEENSNSKRIREELLPRLPAIRIDMQQNSHRTSEVLHAKEDSFKAIVIHISCLCPDLVRVNADSWTDTLVKYFQIQQGEALTNITTFMKSVRGLEIGNMADEEALKALSVSLHFTVQEDGEQVLDLLDVHDQLYGENLKRWQAENKEFSENNSKVRSAIIRLKDKGWKVGVVHPGGRLRLALDTKACQIANLVTVVVSGACLSKAARPYKVLYEEAVSRLDVDPSTVLVVAGFALDVLDILQCDRLECVVVAAEKCGDKFPGTPIRLETTCSLADFLSQCATRTHLSSWLNELRQETWEPQVGDQVMAQFLDDRLVYRAQYLGDQVVFEGYGNLQTIDRRLVYK